jgi:hypothetical protein
MDKFVAWWLFIMVIISIGLVIDNPKVDRLDVPDGTIITDIRNEWMLGEIVYYKCRINEDSVYRGSNRIFGIALYKKDGTLYHEGDTIRAEDYEFNPKPY